MFEIVSSFVFVSIKEIRMIPSEVQPAYEPAVVEKYRFETMVKGQVTAQETQQTDQFQGVSSISFFLYHLHATDLKLTSQLIWPPAKGRLTDEMIKLWVDSKVLFFPKCGAFNLP